MKRIVFTTAFAALIFATAAGISQAAPIAPLEQGFTVNHSNVIQARWRQCWRGRWGRLHCRWRW